MTRTSCQISRVPVTHRFSGAAGEYHRRDEIAVLANRRRQLRQLVALGATVAHELAHARLLGEQRSAQGRSDGEQLTDLTTIVLGAGILTVNAAFDYAQTQSGWQSSHLGYLDETLSGYALAYFAYLRGERDPVWAAALGHEPANLHAPGTPLPLAGTKKELHISQAPAAQRRSTELPLVPRVDSIHPVGWMAAFKAGQGGRGLPR